MWEEFTHSIHSFLEDKAKVAAIKDSKKTTPKLLIPSIRFTKAIIFNMQKTLNFPRRSESALHQSSEEGVVGFLKYGARGSSDIIFGMAIP